MVPTPGRAASSLTILRLQGSTETVVPKTPTSEMRGGRPREQLGDRGICPSWFGDNGGPGFMGFACALGHLSGHVWVCSLICKMG